MLMRWHDVTASRHLWYLLKWGCGMWTARHWRERTRLPWTYLGLIALAGCLLTACNQTSTRPPALAPTTPTPTVNTTPTSAPVVHYVAIGASDSFGIGTDHPATQNWPTLIAGKLGQSVQLLNLGIPGATVAQANRDEVPIALDVQPQIITVLLGINDLDEQVPPETFAAEMRTLLTALAHSTDAHIFVANLPDLSLLPYFAKRSDVATLTEWERDYNAAIASICTELGVTLVDLSAAWNLVAQHPEFIGTDGLHPSTQGAVEIADIFVNTMLLTLPAIS